MLAAILLSTIIMFFTIGLHYLTFRQTSRTIEKLQCSCYAGLSLAVIAITLAHILEAGIYAAGFWLGDTVFQIGSFKVDQEMTWMDYFYFSLVNFTTLGRGDITPMEHLRFIAGIEAFNGFLMITASGSYVLQVMAGKPPMVGQNG